jgi:polyisoprenyl-phosphate glycosyltransferase
MAEETSAHTLPHSINVVVPVFNEAGAVHLLVKAVANMARANQLRVHLVLVDDGSTRDGVPLDALAGEGLSGEVIRLWRNAGHQRAIAIGLAHVLHRKEQAPAIVMDGDGEDRPEDIAGLLQVLGDAPAGVVVAERRRRRESALFRAGYWFYRLLFRVLTGRTIRFGNFCALGPQAVGRLVHMEETWLHLPAALLRSGLEIRKQSLDRGTRYLGSSKMDLVALTVHGLSAIAVFSEPVLTRIIAICLAVIVAAAGATVVAISLKLAGLASPGWLTTVAGILVVAFVQAVGLCLVCLILLLHGRRTATSVPYNTAVSFVQRVDQIFGGRP